jgi:hypothetical protein
MFLIHLCLLSWSFFSIENGKSVTGGLGYKRKCWYQSYNYVICKSQLSSFFYTWYVLTYNDRVCSIHFINRKPTKENPDPCLHMGHDSTTLHKKPRPHVIRGEPVIKKRKLTNVTISSEPTTSMSNY